jgi:hypothetical protein
MNGALTACLLPAAHSWLLIHQLIVPTQPWYILVTWVSEGRISEDGRIRREDISGRALGAEVLLTMEEDGFSSAEPSPSYSPQASPEPAEGTGSSEAAALTAAQGPLVYEANPVPAPVPASPIAGASQLAGGCSSGEAETLAAPATPAQALPAAPAADAAVKPAADAAGKPAADDAWKCSFCACEHVGTEATFLSCKLCNTTRNPTTRKPPHAHRQAAPQPTVQPPATTSESDDDDVPLSRRAPSAARPATPAAAKPASASSKHKLPAASAADRPPAKKLRQSSGGAPAGKKAEEAEEQRYDHDGQLLYP